MTCRSDSWCWQRKIVLLISLLPVLMTNTNTLTQCPLLLILLYPTLLCPIPFLPFLVLPLSYPTLSYPCLQPTVHTPPPQRRSGFVAAAAAAALPVILPLQLQRQLGVVATGRTAQVLAFESTKQVAFENAELAAFEHTIQGATEGTARRQLGVVAFGGNAQVAFGGNAQGPSEHTARKRRNHRNHCLSTHSWWRHWGNFSSKSCLH